MQSLSDESINAIADILRSFFRQLEDPLIPTKFHEELYKICKKKFMYSFLRKI